MPGPERARDAAEASRQFALVPKQWFELGLSHRQFFVGVAILMHFDPNRPDECYPSIARLERITGVFARHVRTEIKALEERGAIEIVRSSGVVNRYRPRTAPVPGPQQSPGTGAVLTPGTGAVTPPGTGAVRVTDHLSDQRTDHVAETREAPLFANASPATRAEGSSARNRRLPFDVALKQRSREIARLVWDNSAAEALNGTKSFEAWRKQYASVADDLARLEISDAQILGAVASFTERRGRPYSLRVVQDELARIAAGSTGSAHGDRVQTVSKAERDALEARYLTISEGGIFESPGDPPPAHEVFPGQGIRAADIPACQRPPEQGGLPRTRCPHCIEARAVVRPAPTPDRVQTRPRELRP